MRAYLPRFALLFGLLFALAVAGCSDDESDTPGPADAGFANEDADTVGPDQGPIDVGFDDTGVGAMDAEVDVDTGGFEDAAEPDAMVDAGFAMDAGPGDMGPADGGPPNLNCDPNAFPAAACGGVLAGTMWNYVDACGESATVQMLLGQCPGSTIASLTRTVTGTLSFSVNMTYQIALSDTVEADLTISAFCVSVLEGCPGVEGFFATAGATAMCTPVGTACRCDVSLTQPVAETGTYSTSGTQVTAVPSGGIATTINYCVDPVGPVLRYREVDDPSTFVLTQ